MKKSTTHHKKSSRKRLSFLRRLVTLSICLYSLTILFFIDVPSSNNKIAGGLIDEDGDETIRNIVAHGVPVKNRILYVHIGKTGGEYVKAQLQVSCKTRKNKLLKQECQDRFHGVPSTQVSQQTVGYLHVDSILYPRNAIPLATHYMYTLRNPLDRVISWYIYNHPSSCDRRDSSSPSCQMKERPSESWGVEFFQCFPTMDSWGRALVAASSKPNNEKCNQVAWKGINGQAPDKELNHLLWNYKVSYPKRIACFVAVSYTLVSHCVTLIYYFPYCTCLVLLE